MRVHWKQPKKEIRIVRPDNEGDEYQVWVLVPVNLGSMLKNGSHTVVDGIKYGTLNDGARHLLENHREHQDMLGELNLPLRAATNQVTVTGLDLVTQNAWTKFCEMRKINPRNTAEMNKQFTMSKQEYESLTKG